MAHACFVRSPFAHALVRNKRLCGAGDGGVVAVAILADLRPQLVSELCCWASQPKLPSGERSAVLASEEVCCWEPVAVVITISTYC